MDFKSLKYFISVTRHLNFTKAAKECSISQTAMSLQISKLEEELNFKLFTRNNRNVSLTTGGARFLIDAKKIVKDYEEAVAEGYKASLGYEGSLRIGVSNFEDSTYLTDYIQEFHRDYPNVLIESVMDINVNLPEGFRKLNVDVSLGVPYELQIDPDINLIPLVRRPLRFVLNVNHPLAGVDKINPRSFGNEKFFILTVTHLQRTADRIKTEWAMSGIDPSRLVEINGYDDILFLVSCGLGVGILPYHLPSSRSLYYNVADFEKGAPYADLSLAYMPSNPNPALKLFLDLFKKKIKDSSSLV
jgi:DNA-binding transcriptional LysR family regulator